MADTNEAVASSGGDVAEVTQLTFKVKTSGDKLHTVTMPETAKVMELKTKLAGEDMENVAVERQRLIYSGRVMKNDDALSVYKIKNNNTVHMVKSAASNPVPPSSGAAASTSAAPAVPQNMAAGTSAGNILAGLTGARYAGHASLPSRDIFGADGGMGAPPSEDHLADMLSNPNMAQMMNEALSNPNFIDMMIQQNPALAAMPNAREVLQSPLFRQMLTNPHYIREAARMRRAMAGGPAGGGFPAPGATDQTPPGAAATSADDSDASFARNAGALNDRLASLFAAPNNPFLNYHPFLDGPRNNANNPFASPSTANPFTDNANNPFLNPNASRVPAANPFAALFGAPAANPASGSTAPASGAAASTPTTAAGGNTGTGSTGTNPASGVQPNPFAASLFGPNNPFGNVTPEMMQLTMQMLGGGSGEGAGSSPFGAGSPFGASAFGAAPAAPDNRPPEERYADQLQQLNDMGFTDFDRNVAALRRSGGSVQGAVDQLLNR